MSEHPDIGAQLTEQLKIAQALMRIVINPKTQKDIRREAVSGLCGYTHIEEVVDVLINVMENHRIDEETRLIATIGLSDHTYPEIDISGENDDAYGEVM
ncbi:hypothetical protein ACFL14_02310 [Patescibacteria group bacterium]